MVTAVGLWCRQRIDRWGPRTPGLGEGIEGLLKRGPAPAGKGPDLYFTHYATQVLREVLGPRRVVRRGDEEDVGLVARAADDPALRMALRRRVGRVRKNVDRCGHGAVGSRDVNRDATVTGGLERVQAVPVVGQRSGLEDEDLDQCAVGI